MGRNSRAFCWILTPLCIWFCDAVKISFNLDTLILEPGEYAFLDIQLSASTEENATLEFLYQEDDKILPYQVREIISELPPITLVPGKVKYSTPIIAEHVGEMLLLVNSSSPEIVELSQVYVVVRILSAIEKLVLGILCGWIYLIAWSTKQIPQVYLSWKTKSVEGVSLDFVVFNTVGNMAYMVYTVLFYTIGDIRTMYKSLHPLGSIPVELNDVICICFMTFISFVQVGQCFIYSTGGQKISRMYLVLLTILGIGFTVMLIITLYDILYWLTFLTVLSYLKVLSAPLKLTPQIYYHYVRSSTEGWSVWYSWLDLVGGLGSVSQMIINAQNEDDWGSLWGNHTKFILGSMHIVFDSVLLFQHFILYRNDTPIAALNQETSDGKKTPPMKGSDASPVAEKEEPNEKSKILQD